MQYYTVDDVIEMTGAKYDKCCEIIRNLNEKYKKQYPLAELIQGKIIKWFYDEAMGIKKDDEKKTEIR